MSEIIIHFDVEEHRVSAETFVTTINSINTIANFIFTNSFHLIDNDIEQTKKLKLKTYIIATDKGGLIEILGFEIPKILTVGTIITLSGIGINRSKEWARFMKGLTGKPYESGQIFEDIGRFIQTISKATKQYLTNTPTENDVLTRKEPLFDIPKKASSDFFRQCSKDLDIKGLGFTRENDFIITRKDFLNRIVQSNEIPLRPTFHDIEAEIVSPVMKHGETRKWILDIKKMDQNIYSTSTRKSITMADSTFNSELLKGQHPLKEHQTPDVICARLRIERCIKDGIEIEKDRIVTNVFTLNGEKISEYISKPDQANKPPSSSGLFDKLE